MAVISWMPWFHFPSPRIAAVYHHSRLTWFRAALCSLSYTLLYTGPSLLYHFFACRCSTKTCNILKLSCRFKWFSLHFHPIYWQKDRSLEATERPLYEGVSSLCPHHPVKKFHPQGPCHPMNESCPQGPPQCLKRMPQFFKQNEKRQFLAVKILQQFCILKADDKKMQTPRGRH